MKKLLILALALAGACATVEKYNPVAAAETVEQKAFAVYGIYVVVLEQAERIFANPATPQKVKDAVALGVLEADPFVDAILGAFQAVESVRASVAKGEEAPEVLKKALEGLEAAIQAAWPAVARLSKVVSSASKDSEVKL